jgi:hypothetical protein
VKRDLEHLKLLSIFYYVLAGLVGLTYSLGLIYVVLGIMIINGAIPAPPPGSGAPGMPTAMGWMFLIFGGCFVLIGWTMAICMISVGVCLSRRKAWMFCCIVAGFICVLNAPLGTILGVFTFIVLLRPRVKDLFDGRIYEPADPDDEDDDDYERPLRRRRPRDKNHVKDDFDDKDDSKPVPEPKETARPRPNDDRYMER